MNIKELPEFPVDIYTSLGVTYNDKKYICYCDFDEERGEINGFRHYFMELVDVKQPIFSLRLEGDTEPTFKLSSDNYWKLMKQMFPEYFTKGQ